jgi:hypothetical protein
MTRPATASADDSTIRRAPAARRNWIFTAVGGCAIAVLIEAGCARTAVIVDNPPPNTTTVVTVEHVPQTQPTDKNLIIRAED